MTGIAEALGATGRRIVYLVGSGGKTTTMFALAHQLSLHARVVTTTSTRIGYPTPEQSPFVVTRDDPGRAARELAARLVGPGHVTLARALGSDGKLHGYGLAALDELHNVDVADVWLVEADGAAGRPLKAHAPYEPVVSARADLVIAVVGAGAVGQPLTDACVHRCGLAVERLGKVVGATVDRDDVARLVLHADGYLRGTLCDVTLLVAGAGPKRLEATHLADAIREADVRRLISRFVVGELAGTEPFVECLAQGFAVGEIQGSSISTGPRKRMP